MANLRALRSRIRSVKNTQQITKAMKMVAAAKLRRAQDGILAARPYAEAMTDVLETIATRVGPSAHPLLQEREAEDRILLVVVTADKGLCGSFNANILRQAQNFLKDREDKEVHVQAVGRKGVDYFKRRDYPLRDTHSDVFTGLEFNTAAHLGDGFVEAFLEEGFDAVYVLYNEFQSVIQQRLVTRRLLPVPRSETEVDGPTLVVDYLYEPAPKELLEELLPKYIRIQVWRALLESNAAEQGARMTAMDSATRNAGEMIEDLTLTMNKIRQASITTEILEVVGGAEALG